MVLIIQLYYTLPPNLSKPSETAIIKGTLSSVVRLVKSQE